ncbi:hypothetical protein M0R72_00250 [Candidatus Pacearchaeota archaeon]|nr:hypothetical protein [Candidatus Pacearchaeota archaeon]
MLQETSKCHVCGLEISDGQSVYCCDACFQQDQMQYTGPFRPQIPKQVSHPVDLNSLIGTPIYVGSCWGGNVK